MCELTMHQIATPPMVTAELTKSMLCQQLDTLLT